MSDSPLAIRFSSENFKRYDHEPADGFADASELAEMPAREAAQLISMQFSGDTDYSAQERHAAEIARVVVKTPNTWLGSFFDQQLRERNDTSGPTQMVFNRHLFYEMKEQARVNGGDDAVTRYASIVLVPGDGTPLSTTVKQRIKDWVDPLRQPDRDDIKTVVIGRLRSQVQHTAEIDAWAKAQPPETNANKLRDETISRLLDQLEKEAAKPKATLPPPARHKASGG